jgi:predicted O-methyltransferase YrrM
MSHTTRPLDAKLRAYLLDIEPPEHEELRRLRQATEQMPLARFQIAPEQGYLLAFLVQLIDARRTLEIGTFTGYSALAMALALPSDGYLVACEIDEQWIEIGRPFWQRAGVTAKIEVKTGPALATLRSLEQGGATASFDLVFIDANKEDYGSYYESALRLLRPGGVVVLDNMFFRGNVGDPNNTDPAVASIRGLNVKIAADERVDRVVLPVGDGMTLARRRH